MAGRRRTSSPRGRAGRSAARTYADLAALTADIPAEPAAYRSGQTARCHVGAAEDSGRAGRDPARAGAPACPAIRRPIAKAAAVSGVCLGIAAAAIEIGAHIDPNVPGPNPHHAWIAACFSLALGAAIIAAFTVFLGVAVAIEQRRSRRRPPPRSGQQAAAPSSPAAGAAYPGDPGLATAR